MSKGISDNGRLFDAGMSRFEKIKKRSFLMGGRSVARKVLEHIKNSGKYYDVTGNTRGSIAWGIYYDGVLHEISTPYKRIYVRRRTLVKGERDFETGFVARTGDVHYYGYEASEEFLKDYKPSSKGLSVVFVVGTHYAEYIENVRKLNVMTDSVYFVRAAGSGLIKGSFDFESAGRLPFKV
ncbi:hypothetical protein [Bacteroides pyogenes]|nr:hypothetical protein [Bacteroides pyogenes]